MRANGANGYRNVGCILEGEFPESMKSAQKAIVELIMGKSI